MGDALTVLVVLESAIKYPQPLYISAYNLYIIVQAVTTKGEFWSLFSRKVCCDRIALNTNSFLTLVKLLRNIASRTFFLFLLRLEATHTHTHTHTHRGEE